MSDTASILRSVFIEEMLHMSIACNLLNAIKGTLLINKHATIGQFYLALIEKIKEFGDSIFTGDPTRQVFGTWFPVQNCSQSRTQRRRWRLIVPLEKTREVIMAIGFLTGKLCHTIRSRQWPCHILSTMNKAHWAKLCGFASLGCSSCPWLEAREVPLLVG